MRVVGLVVLASLAMAEASTSAKLSRLYIQKPSQGSCRLQALSDDSDNVKYAASVSSKDLDLFDGCDRCISITKGDKSVTGYVVDVCDSSDCKSGTAKMSKAGLSKLGMDENSNGEKVSYEVVTCPSSFLGGNIKACLMDGASANYIPLQFSSANKPIESVKINGVKAKKSPSSFLFAADISDVTGSTSDWYESIQVIMTASDSEVLTADLSFGTNSGCATSGVQFSAANTADGQSNDGRGGAGGGGGAGSVIGIIVGVVGALMLVAGSVFFVYRRRKNRMDGEDSDDIENQNLSPKTRASPSVPTYPNEKPKNNPATDDDDHFDVDYTQAQTPPAGISSAPQESTPAVTHQAPAAAVPTHEASAPASPSSSSSEDEAASPVSARPQATFSYSSHPYAPVDGRQSLRNSQLSSSQKSSGLSLSQRKSAQEAPTVPSPYLPTMSAHRASSPRVMTSESKSSDRPSFDIDDMRQSDELKASDLGLEVDEEIDSTHLGGSGNYGRKPSYEAPAAYSSEATTSPSNHLKAMSMRRSSKEVARAPTSSPDFYSSRGAEFDGDMSRMSSSRGQANSSGYSRDSLNILGYPYSKRGKTGRQSNGITEVQF